MFEMKVKEKKKKLKDSETEVRLLCRLETKDLSSKFVLVYEQTFVCFGDPSS